MGAAGLPPQRDARLHPPGAGGHLHLAGDASIGGYPPHPRRRQPRAPLPDGRRSPAAGVIYVWFDALINYITGAGFPDDPASFAKWWPADLHVVGKDINRFHTVIWPAMLMSAGLPLPRKVWVHGWLLTQGERMSKSRGNFLEPADVVNAFGQDGARYVTLREVAFDKDTEVSWDSFLRRYNADLANDLGNLINRSISMTNRYLDGERPHLPRDGALGAAWPEVLAGYAARIEAACCTRRSPPSGGSWGRQPLCRRAAAVGPGQGSHRRRRRRRGRRCGMCSVTLLEACRRHRPDRGAVHARRRRRASSPQLGHGYPYAADGNGGPPLEVLAAWGAVRGSRPDRRDCGAHLPPPGSRTRSEPNRISGAVADSALEPEHVALAEREGGVVTGADPGSLMV